MQSPAKIFSYHKSEKYITLEQGVAFLPSSQICRLMKQNSPRFFPLPFSRVTDEAGTRSLLLVSCENNVLLARRVCISTMGHHWVHFTDLNKGIFDRPANVDLSWEMDLCSTLWGEAGGVCSVATQRDTSFRSVLCQPSYFKS